MGIQTGSERIKRMYKRNYSNEQVEKAVKIVELADREPATPDETRQILSLKGGPDI